MAKNDLFHEEVSDSVRSVSPHQHFRIQNVAQRLAHLQPIFGLFPPSIPQCAPAPLHAKKMDKGGRGFGLLADRTTTLALSCTPSSTTRRDTSLLHRGVPVLKHSGSILLRQHAQSHSDPLAYPPSTRIPSHRHPLIPFPARSVGILTEFESPIAATHAESSPATSPASSFIV